MRALIYLLVVLAGTPLLGCTRQPQAAPPDSAAKPAESSTITAPQLAEVVPDLPDFPNAVLTAQAEKGPAEGWTKIWKREIRVTAPYQDVRKFYLEQFESKGWKISSAKEKATEVEWGLTKGASWAEIEIEAKSSGMVKIKVERKDR
jgi:hypothetical protein